MDPATAAGRWCSWGSAATAGAGGLPTDSTTIDSRVNLKIVNPAAQPVSAQLTLVGRTARATAVPG